MNWRLSSLDSITLISNSDAHSPAKIGREANIFDTGNPPMPPFGKGGREGIDGISYEFIESAIKTRQGFSGTVEFFPEEGKYHYDGHRSCGVSFSPEETVSHDYRCPVCGKRVTIGVMHRVATLADRREGYHLSGAPPYISLIPLQEIIAEIMKVGVNSKAVNSEYFRLIDRLGNELGILMDIPLEDIEREGSPQL
jgi:PHP family Zn ribbon phosphoesterase